MYLKLYKSSNFFFLLIVSEDERLKQYIFFALLFIYFFLVGAGNIRSYYRIRETLPQKLICWVALLCIVKCYFLHQHQDNYLLSFMFQRGEFVLGQGVNSPALSQNVCNIVLITQKMQKYWLLQEGRDRQSEYPDIYSKSCYITLCLLPEIQRA